MRLLLDTHVFLWWDSSPEKLSPQAFDLCSDPDNELLLSAASIWEMQIKQQLGKLSLRLPLREIIDSQCSTNGLILLHISPEHTLALDSLPALHKDPFDRLLVSQTRSDALTLLSADAQVQQYPVNWVW